jgi:membrane associated rhomboid family serine protease
VIPIRDTLRSLTTPHFTRILIIVNVIVFLVYWLPGTLERAILTYGMIPAFIIRRERLGTLITSMFLHADLLHLGMNMLYLYIFGDNVEDGFGHGRYFLAYFLSGIAASVIYIWALMSTHDTAALLTPTIGASGAISGVLGAYLVLYPKARVLTLVLLGWIFIVPVPAILFLGFWFAYQLLYGMLVLGLGAFTSVAYWAHIGGFVAGLVFGLAWRGRRKRRDF